MNGTSTRSRDPAWVLPALLGVLAVAAALRVRELVLTPLWVDEIYVLFVARRPWGEMLDTVASDIHPPLWFALAHGWRSLGGECERWLKALPIAFALAGVIGTFALARRLAGARAGLVAATLLALHTAHVHWSQQFEQYVPLWTLLTWLALAAWSLHRRPAPAAAAATAGLAIAALHTDYLAPFVIASVVAWGAFALRSDRRGLRWWLGTFAAATVLFAPQATVWATQFAREGYGAHFRWPAFADLARLVRVVSFGPAWMMLVTFGLAAVAVARPATRRAAALLLAVMLPPLLATRAWPLVTSRDMLHVLPFAMVLVSLGLAGIRWRPLRWAMLVLLLAFATRRVITAEPWAEPRALWRAELRLRGLAAPGDLVLHAEPHTLLYGLYHMPGLRHRLLAAPGERVPYFDDGLVIADSLYLSSEAWRRQVESGRRWFALHADRAFVQYGIARRAGVWARARFDSAAAIPAVSDSPIRLWVGRAPGDTAATVR